MKKIVFLLLLFTISLANGEICAYFFYRSGCPHCEKVAPLLNELSATYSMEVKKIEITDPSGYDFFDKLCDKYCITIRGVPTVFIGEKVLVGDRPIEENFENEIKNCLTIGCPCPTEIENITGIVTTESGTATHITPEIVSPLNFAAIFTAALIDSINPCAFAVLIFLLAYLLAIGSKRRMLLSGGLYIAVVYITYFLSGLGIFSAIQSLSLTMAVRNVVIVIAFIVGIINIKDYFWYGKGPTLEIPKSAKPTIEKLIAGATPLSAVLLGFFVSMVELPCTGGPYLTILAMLAEKTTLVAGIPYLLLYNLIFVLPLVIILVLVYFGYGVTKIEEWRKMERRRMKLVAGLVMLAFAVLLLFKII